MEFFGKHEVFFPLEFEIKDEGYEVNENKEIVAYSIHLNKKHLKALKKGYSLTRKYLAKMQKLGFKASLQEIKGENNADT